jgi:hypothetical protein
MIFSTKEFSFDDQLFRIYKNHQIENVPFNEIIMIEIKKGTHLKRPKSALVFGIVLVVLCLVILRDYKSDWSEFFASGVILRILGVLFFVGGVGVYSIYSALPIHPIIEIKHQHWTECLSISGMIKSGKIEPFSEFLRLEFANRFKRTL